MKNNLRGFWKEENAPAKSTPTRKKKRKKGQFRKTPRCQPTPSDIFFKSKRWRALRRSVLEEHGYRCMRCGSVEEIQVDHIKPRSRFQKLEWCRNNFQVLCGPCNYEKFNYHSTDYRDKAACEELDFQLLTEIRRFV